MCEDINIATLSSSTWLVLTHHGAVATNETGWSVPTVGLTFDDLQQNLTFVALALQRSQAHFTQPLLWVRPAGQLPQTTTRQLTSFFWKHLGTKVLVPRPYTNHQKTRYPGGNFQSSDPTWSPRSPCKSIISARAPPWQVKHSNDDLTKKVETCMAKEMAVKSVHFWCDSDVLGKLLDGFFFQFAIEPLWHLVTFALSTSFLILRMFSTDSPRRILNEQEEKKQALTAEMVDQEQSWTHADLNKIQGLRTAWVKAAPHRRQWLPRSLRLHAKCQECPATGGIQETQTRKAHLIVTFFVA